MSKMKSTLLIMAIRLGQLPNVCYIDRQSIISTIYTGFSPDIGEKMEAETKKLLMIIRARE